MRQIESCPICEGKSFKTRYPSNFSGTWEDAVPLFLANRVTAKRGQIVTCQDCDFIFTNPQFTPEDYAKIYGSITPFVETEGHERGQIARFNIRNEITSKYFQSGKFLDLGCGAGVYHRSLTKFEGYGFEVRPRSDYEYQEQERIYLGNFRDFASKPEHAEKFDFVTAWDVIEHVTDPQDYFEAVKTILKPGGIFIWSVPDPSCLTARVTGKNWNCYLLEHLWYFTPKTLKQFANKMGFEVLETHPMGFPVDFQSVVQRLAQTYGGKNIPLPGFIGNRVIKLPIGLMYSVTRKKDLADTDT